MVEMLDARMTFDHIKFRDYTIIVLLDKNN